MAAAGFWAGPKPMMIFVLNWLWVRNALWRWLIIALPLNIRILRNWKILSLSGAGCGKQVLRIASMPKILWQRETAPAGRCQSLWLWP